MRVAVFGSIGNQTQSRREFLVDHLRAAGFEVITFGQEYDKQDWRGYFDESQKIIEQSDLDLERSHPEAIAADLSGPSDGRARQLMNARGLGIPTVGFAPVATRSPFWQDVDELFTDVESLIIALKEIERELINEKLKRRVEEELKERNPFYRLWGEAWRDLLGVTAILTIFIIFTVILQVYYVAVVMTIFYIFLAVWLARIHRESRKFRTAD